ncbi:MAG: three-Cys-motif partner protein TcmP [Chitinophagaceae bacterium]
MKQFGGNWTEQKIEMIVGYAKAYLTIMNKYPQFKIMYFDGFAGSGDISRDDENEVEIIKGAAMRILEITNPKDFDIYYFVEKNEQNKQELQRKLVEKFNNKQQKWHVVNEDCNKKLLDMVEFLSKNKNFRVLAFVDPFGMSLNWSSVEALKNLGVDLWILVPTGIGVNRLLVNDGNISDSWYSKLEKFLGVDREEIKKVFYKSVTYHNLFDGITTIEYKENNSIQKIHKLYKERLLTVFKFVSDAFVMRNSTNSIMYHFMMATNNSAALKIANDIVKPKYKL